MKVIVILVSASLLVLEKLFSLSLTLIILGPPIVFGLIATILSLGKRSSYLNELPNVVRVLFASIGSALIGFFSLFHITLGSLFILFGVFANDEAMRRLYRQKGVIVLTGIDATGKSTHARRISSWLRNKGIDCRIVPFDKYLFLGRISGFRKRGEKTSQAVGKRVPVARTSRFSLIRPYIALIDNVLLYVVRIFPRIAKREYVVCDRFIWDNYVKHKALGYSTWSLFWLSTLIRPKIGVVFDLPAEIAFERVEKRHKHLRYSIEQYETERKEFRRIAKMLDYRIIETNEPVQKTWDRIEAYLNSSI
jgi:thymidylate kinase